MLTEGWIKYIDYNKKRMVLCVENVNFWRPRRYEKDYFNNFVHDTS